MKRNDAERQNNKNADTPSTQIVEQKLKSDRTGIRPNCL